MPPIKKFTGTIFVTFKDLNTGSFSFSYNTYAEDRRYANQIPLHEDHDAWYKLALYQFLAYVNSTSGSEYTEEDVQTVEHSVSGHGSGATACSECGPSCNDIYSCGCCGGCCSDCDCPYYNNGKECSATWCCPC